MFPRCFLIIVTFIQNFSLIHWVFIYWNILLTTPYRSFFLFSRGFCTHSLCMYLLKTRTEFMLYRNTLDKFCVIRHHFLVSRFLIIFFWIACGRDGSAKLWDCGTSKCLVNLYAGSSVINSCSMQDYTSNSFTRVSARSK